MKLPFIYYKQTLLTFCFLAATFISFGQSETSTWKAQLAFGINAPSQKGFVSNFEGKAVNFPTINLGVQRMFSRQFGAKLDFGYNRISNSSGSPEFKLNYSRINAQLVFDATNKLSFLPQGIGVVPHVGPGFTFVKPLGDYPDNKISFFNVMAGVEIHYNLARTYSVFVDTSYIYGLSKDFDPDVEGFGSFNGSLLTVSVGISVSLSGCYFCE